MVIQAHSGILRKPFTSLRCNYYVYHYKKLLSLSIDFSPSLYWLHWKWSDPLVMISEPVVMLSNLMGSLLSG